tara:strand:- start:234 stop:485 length:252 start_codon:yes stop_codon:yes gene_type:complete
MRATTIAAVRAHYIAKIRNLYPNDPDSAIEAEADTLFMDNPQLIAYYAILEHGSTHHWTAANLVESVPHEHLSECIRQLTGAV